MNNDIASQAKSTNLEVNVGHKGLVVIDSTNVMPSLSSCLNVNEFKETISQILKQWGFAYFSFTVLDTLEAKRLTNLPEEIKNFYLSREFCRQDIFSEHAKEDGGPLYISDVTSYIDSAPFITQQIQINVEHFRLLGKFNIQDGYFLSHSFGKSHKALLSIFCEDSSREEFENRINHCQGMLSMFLQAIIFFGHINFSEYFLNEKYDGEFSLTPKPLRMLKIVAQEGLLLKEAALRLNISLDTANKHIAAVKQALGATTLANAVYLAMQNNLLSDDDENEDKAVSV